MDPLAKVLDINGLLSLFGQINALSVIRAIAEALLIGYACVWLWGRIRGTQAERMVKGVFIVAALAFFCWLAGFTLVTSVVQQLLPVIVLGLIIIFQQEIRRGLAYIGRGKGFRFELSLSDAQRDKAQVVIEQVINAVRELARTKTGALIVIEPLGGDRDYLSPGIPVNADVSSNLILSIFFPNSPLHDGAVIIRGDKIVAAGVILPMTDNPKISYRYGTRHRAAIGLSELYDALCIVVSEETGFISAASRGMLVRYSNADELSAPLAYIYDQSGEMRAQSRLRSFLALFGRSRVSGSATGSDTMLRHPEQSEEDTATRASAIDKELSINPKIERELVD